MQSPMPAENLVGVVIESCFFIRMLDEWSGGDCGYVLTGVSGMGSISLTSSRSSVNVVLSWAYSTTLLPFL